METEQAASGACDEDPGWAWGSGTRPPLGTTAAGAATTHLVKDSPRSITTAVFSPPLPRPSYSGMVVNKPVRRRALPDLGCRQLSALGGGAAATARRWWRGRGPRVAAAHGARAVPGCASLRVGLLTLAGARVPGTRKVRVQAAADLDAGDAEDRGDQARRVPRVGAEPTPGSFPPDTPSNGAGAGVLSRASVLRSLNLSIAEDAERSHNPKSFDSCSLGTKFAVPGVLPIIYSSQEISEVGVTSLRV